ncbi:MAG: glycosyl hydrolase family 18 protein [Bacteroidota bacterium]
MKIPGISITRNAARYSSNFITIIGLVGIILFNGTPIYAQSSIWVTAYYAGWQQGYHNLGYLPAQNVDFSAVTHINHFSLVPRSDGTLDDVSNTVTADNAAVLIPLAHAAGVKVLITVGGWGSNVAFRGSTDSTHLPLFVYNLVTLMQSRGYDGIDIDWEVLEHSDSTQYKNFITELRAALDTISPRPLLTAATAWFPEIFSTLANKFDQINLMSYDLSGPWRGWVSWHNAAVTDGGYNFPSTGRPVPSADGMVADCLNAGIPIAKLGIGIDFYGYVWSGGHGTPNGGVTDPRQSWISPPSMRGNVAYSSIMQTYFRPEFHRFDNGGLVSYLSIDNPGSVNDKFISYDDELTCYKKIQYARSKGIGGVIIWELGGAHRSDLPPGQQDPLLEAVKQAVNGTYVYDAVPPTISFASPANGANITDTLTLSATASDNVGVVGVQFQLNGANLGPVISSPPYAMNWNSALAPNGSSTIYAIAWDAMGNSAKDSVTLNIFNVHPPPPVFTYHAVWQDNFVGSDQNPLSGGKWTALLNPPDSGAMEIVSNAMQPYNAKGYGYAASVAWDSLLSKGAGASLVVTQKSNDAQFSSLLLYARMNSLDFNTGNGYRFRYVDDPSGPDQLSIELVNNGTFGTAMVSALHEVNVGDTLKFIVQDDSVSTLVAYVNSTQVLSVVDTTYNPLNGYMWLASFVLNTVPRFNNFKIISSTVPDSLAIPDPPVLFSPVSQTNGVTINPVVRWNPSIAATAYRFQLYTSPNFSSTIVDTTISGTSVSINNLTRSSSYYWRVNAGNAKGTSDWSDIWYFVTTSAADGLPIQLSSFTASSKGSTGVALNWTTTTETNNYGFYVERRAQSEIVFKIISPFIPGAGTSLQEHQYAWNDSSAIYGTYYYRLKQIDLTGSSVYSNPIVITVTGVTGVIEDAAPRIFQLLQNYPNPFNPTTEIKFSVQNAEHATLLIYNILGQLVGTVFDGLAQPGHYYRVPFDGSRLGSGVYIYRLVTNSHVDTKKLLLVK